MSVTPELELVVAPAGYSLKATAPAALAARTSSADVESVRYSVMSGRKLVPAGRQSLMRSSYATAYISAEWIQTRSALEAFSG